jgi:hypothetical protein
VLGSLVNIDTDTSNAVAAWTADGTTIRSISMNGGHDWRPARDVVPVHRALDDAVAGDGHRSGLRHRRDAVRDLVTIRVSRFTAGTGLRHRPGRVDSRWRS